MSKIINYDNYKNWKHFEFLQDFKGEITVIENFVEGYFKKPEFKFNGTITNQRLRQILPHEVVYEFDHLKEDKFEERRAEADKWISQLRAVFDKIGLYYRVTDHEGKSPHFRFVVAGLEKYPHHIRREYKKRVFDSVLSNFKSDLVVLDNSLIRSEKKLISIENRPHFKPKWNDAIEKIIFENKNGTIEEVNEKIIKEIESEIKKKDRPLDSLTATPEDINLEKLNDFFQKYYLIGERNNITLAFSGLMRRLGYNFNQTCDTSYKILSKLSNDRLNGEQIDTFIKSVYNEMEYAFNLERNEVAVKVFLEDESENNNRYEELLDCFSVNNVTLRKLDDKVSELNKKSKPNEIKQLIEEINNSMLDKSLKEFLIEDISKKTGRGKKIVKELASSHDSILKKDRFPKYIELIDRVLVEVYLSKFNEPFISIEINEKVDNFPVSSEKFGIYILKIIFEELQDAISDQDINKLRNYYNAKAYERNKKYENFVRVAKVDGSYYLDLNNDSFDILEIDKEGIRLTTRTDIKFLRSSSMDELKIDLDVKIDDVDLLDDYIFTKSDTLKQILYSYIASLFDEKLPKPINEMWGEEGSSKSMSQSNIKKLIDPSKLEYLSLRKEDDVIRELSKNYIIVYDNLNSISNSISNLFCRAVYGENITSRVLYTNDDDKIYSFRRCILVNGINSIIKNPDAIDRTMRIELSRIPDNMRKGFQEVLDSFNDVQPKITGAFLKLFQKSLALRNEVKSDIKSSNILQPRLVDFFIVGESVSRVLGNEKGFFMNNYLELMNSVKKDALNSDIVGGILVKYLTRPENNKYTNLIDYFNTENMSDFSTNPYFLSLNDDILELIHQKGASKISVFIGSASDLLNELNMFEDNSRNKYFPNTSNHLANKINQLKTVLEESNIYLFRKTIGNVKYIILVTLVEKDSEKNYFLNNDEKYTID